MRRCSLCSSLDRTHGLYRSRQTETAASLANLEDLLSWYRNVRTKFGRLKKAMIKSGEGGLEHITERQEWPWMRHDQIITNGRS